MMYKHIDVLFICTYGCAASRKHLALKWYMICKTLMLKIPRLDWKMRNFLDGAFFRVKPWHLCVQLTKNKVRKLVVLFIIEQTILQLCYSTKKFTLYQTKSFFTCCMCDICKNIQRYMFSIIHITWVCMFFIWYMSCIDWLFNFF